MEKDEALYQLKQNIKMHEIEGTTSNQNEREKALLDYITNLQEENQRLTAESTEWESKFYDMQDNFHNANEEIEKLKKLCDKYEEEHNTTFKLWKMKMEEMPTYEEKIEMQKENERLKEYKEDLLSENIELENIRKEAIEYINQAIENGEYFEDDISTDIEEASYDKYVNANDLLEILQGEQNE